ncbi:TetR family transcriptional regulator [Klenkia terrae]|uniref:TetR family transcriptional regulator n=1 Tax=Klenkia terrae TaxID=1052259 RepID=UPI00361CE974
MTGPAPDAREATRARIEAAALDLFTRHDFETVTADEVADAAGISRRTFFRHFATKADTVWGTSTPTSCGWRGCWRQPPTTSRCWHRSARPTSRSTTTPTPTCRCCASGCG